MKTLLIAATGAALLSLYGCAATADAANTEPHAKAYEEPTYRTGSNIPVRDKTPMTEQEKADKTAAAQRTLEQMRQTGAGLSKQ